MTLQDFKNKYNGQEVDTDGYYGGQCLDLMHQYIVDVLGLPLSLFAAPTAYEAYKNANDSRFDKIANTPTGVPQPGDIVFWNTGVGPAGHVAIFLEGDANNFKSFDQNWPTGSKVHVQDHTYKSVAGWLHYKGTPQNTVSVDSTTFQTLVDKSTKYDSFNAAGYTTVDDVVRKLGELNNEKNGLQNSLNEEIQKSQDLRDVLDKQTKADADLGTQLLDAQHKVDELTKELETVKAEKAQPAEQAKDEAIKYYEPKIEELLKNIGRGKKTRSFIDRIWRWLS